MRSLVSSFDALWTSAFSRLRVGALLVIGIVFGMIAPVVSGPTNVSGPISTNTTWTLAGTPYIVTGSILVNSGATLTIEPGVEVKFNDEKAMQIDGELIGQGTSDNPITFTSNVGANPGDWGYILFTDTSVDAVYDAGGEYVSGSIIQYAVIEYGGGASVSDNGALRIDASSPFIDHTTIRNSASNGIRVFNDGAPKMTYNTITGNAGQGISITSNGSVEITYSTISNNNDGGIDIHVSPGAVMISGNTITGNSASYGGGIQASGGTVTISNNTITGNSASVSGGGIYKEWGVVTVTISDNIITGNSASTGGGICAYYGPVTITGNIITGNTSSNGGGIWTQYTPVTINHNVIADNSASDSGGGIHTSGTVSYNSILRNSVSGSGNYAAAHLSGSDNFDYNTIVNNLAPGVGHPKAVYISGNPAFNNNNLYGNTGSALYNGNAQGLPNLNATNNWWDTTDEADIQALIYDWFDDSTLGLVDYTPYRTAHNTQAPISPSTGLVPVPGGDSITLTWSPNPESDLAGYKVYYDTDVPGFPYNGTGPIEGNSPIDVGNVTSYTLTGLLPGTEYYFTVTAYDTEADGDNDLFEGHESWYANEVSAVPTALQPDISLSATGHDFGDVQVDSSSAWTLMVSNIGDGDLILTEVSLVSDGTAFSAPSPPILPDTIAAGDSTEIEIQFAPTDAGAFTDTVKVRSNDPVDSLLTVVLRGTGILPNAAPVANAGNDTTVTAGTTVTLNGSGTDADNDSLSYSWSVASGNPAAVTLSDSTAAKPTFTAPTTTGVYRFILTVNDGKVDSAPDTVVVAVASVEHFVFTDNTGDSYSILILSATINDVPLELGDEIGVFTPDGLCAGGVVWSGGATGLAAWVDNSQTAEVDGFTAGEEMFFRVWDQSTDREVPARATYVDGDGKYGTGSSAVVNLVGLFVQKIPLGTGWSWISFNIEPEELSIPSVMASCENLVLMQNRAGQFYRPDYGYNGIGDLNVLDGYKVYLSGPDTAQVEGSPVDPATAIPLIAGWNFISYLPTFAMDAKVAFAPIVDKLKIVQDDEGKFYNPTYDFSNMGNVQVGEGYKLYLSEAATFVYPSGASKPVAYRERIESVSHHFYFAQRTGESYSVLVLSGVGLNAGDEIGLFTQDGRCVGGGVWAGTPLGVTAWVDDSQTPEVDGCRKGDRLTFRIWDTEEDREYEPGVTYLEGTGRIGEGPGAVVRVSATFTPEQYVLSQNYPNPFNPETTIRYRIPKAGRIIVSLYNASGQKTRTLTEGWTESGVHSVLWDGKDEFGEEVAAGIYLCRMQAGTLSRTRKMILLK